MGLKELARADYAAKQAQMARLTRIKSLVLAGGGSVEVTGLGRVDLEAGTAEAAEAVVEAVRALDLVGFRCFAGSPYQVEAVREAMALRRPATPADPKTAAREALIAQGLLK